ncbi:MAG TPA: exodeoxyribonuclease VII small subunit [Brevefilum sp.]
MLENEELQAIKEMDFEAAFEALQENVKKLESEELSLEDALKQYQRGQALARHCAELLEKAELQVRTLAAESTQPIETKE